MSRGRNGDVVPFVLPGPAVARETADGWRRWRTAGLRGRSNRHPAFRFR